MHIMIIVYNVKRKNNANRVMTFCSLLRKKNLYKALSNFRIAETELQH